MRPGSPTCVQSSPELGMVENPPPGTRASEKTRVKTRGAPRGAPRVFWHFFGFFAPGRRPGANFFEKSSCFATSWNFFWKIFRNFFWLAIFFPQKGQNAFKKVGSLRARPPKNPGPRARTPRGLEKTRGAPGKPGFWAVKPGAPSPTPPGNRFFCFGESKPGFSTIPILELFLCTFMHFGAMLRRFHAFFERIIQNCSKMHENSSK